MNIVVIKNLQGSVVSQTVLGGLTIQIFYSVFVPKIMKMVRSRPSYCNNKQAYFFGPPCLYTLLRLYCACREEDEIRRCIGALDEILDLYDADDFNDADLYRSRKSLLGNDVSTSHLPLQSCARTAVRNLEIRKSMSAGLIALTDVYWRSVVLLSV